MVNGRKEPVRGLWRRGDRYYAQLTVEDSFTGQKKVRRVSLCNAEGEPVQTVAQPIEEMHRLKVKRSEDDLPKLGRTPAFSAYADDYLNFIKSGSGMKKPGTIAKEDHILQKWKKHLGGLRAEKAGLARIGFHDLRHYFISYCVMSGIDYMTIAKWMGHRDGGILIGKVYGHLTDDHARRRQCA